ncbi:MAG TPA: TonB family protein [Candidatus Sulfotelmatobacter sp.]|nr:TonB family protein [Candidatus Sulfotelmatobacter sp.]
MLVGRSSQFETIPRRLSFAILPLALCLTAVFVSPSLAQKADKPERKVIVSVKPEYPELLRHAQVGGVVRLKATVQANGTVSNVEILGGNPILADRAVIAVKSWKYAPGPAQTIEDISLSFSPH